MISVLEFLINKRFVETAFKAACMAYRARERGEGIDFTQEELGKPAHSTSRPAKLLLADLAVSLWQIHAWRTRHLEAPTWLF